MYAKSDTEFTHSAKTGNTDSGVYLQQHEKAAA